MSNALPWRTSTLVLAALALPLAAHDDDPKLLRTSPVYRGPGLSNGVPTGMTTNQAQGPFQASGVQLLSWLSISDLGAQGGGTDCWGYVSPSGREYAVVCTEDKTVFVDVTVPTSPQVIDSISGPFGTWRDAKVYGEYAYSVCETSCDGIQVIDLTQIDSGNVTLVNTINGAGSGRTHNVALNEESGFLYRCGGDNNGLRIYDLSNPASPTFVGQWLDRYVHDAQVVTYTSGPYAGKEIAFCCSGLNGGWVDPGLTVLDVTNKQNIQVLDQHFYPNGVYSHQGWLSEDRQYFYLGDELDENGSLPTTTHVVDVSDLSNVFTATTFTNNNQAVGHNLYTHDGLVFEANYSSGLRVFDVAANATNPQEVAWFDTHPENDNDNFDGAWSTYPYLPSGVVLVTDRSRGLFVLWVSDDERLGETYCEPAELNSSGLPGKIVAEGSTVVSQNDLTLIAIDLPPNQNGYFLASQTQGFVPMPGGSQGNLCLAGNIGRFNAQVQNTGSGGSMSIDVNMLSVPTNPPQAILAGETWSFTAWFRDLNPNQTSNFTDGVRIQY